jgi:VanZ family protein
VARYPAERQVVCSIIELKDRNRRISVRLLPIALAVIVFGTAVPVELQAPVSWSLQFNVWNVIVNVLLYAPLGLALSRRSLAAVIIGAATLSVTIETLQIWYVERYGSGIDVLANVVGAGIGVMLARGGIRRQGGAPETFAVDRRTTAGALVGILALLGGWLMSGPPSEISNWDPEFELLLGNERTSDRPWHGEIASFALVPVPLSEQEVRELGDPTQPGARDMLVARGAYIHPEAITFKGDGAKRLGQPISQRFLDLSVKQNGFAIIAKAKTAETQQEGPARLISFSRDQFHRNFDLGQENDRLVFRVRTLLTGPNGMDPHTETSPVIESNRPITVVATFDGAIARVYVDEKLRGRANLAASRCAVRSMCDSDLPITAASFGGLLAIVAVGAWRPLSRPSTVALAITTGAPAALWLFLAAGLPVSNAWTPMMVLAGAACIGFAIRPATSYEPR